MGGASIILHQNNLSIHNHYADMTKKKTEKEMILETATE